MSREQIINKLEAEILEATWAALEPHAKRDALLLIHRELSLPDVGAAIALDDTHAISQWMGEGLLSKPSPEQRKGWGETPRKLFNMVIVQPFVLIHELTQSEEALIFETARPE